jgi:Chlorophyllase enzyme
MQRRLNPRLLLPVVLSGALGSFSVLSACSESGTGDGASSTDLVTAPSASSTSELGSGAPADTASGPVASGPGGPGPATGASGPATGASGPGPVEDTPSGGAGTATLGGEAPSTPDANTGGASVGGGEQGESGTANGGEGEGGASEENGGAQNEPPPTGTTDAGGAPVANGCPAGEWPAADPSMEGPFEVATDEEVGPEAGEPEEDGTVPRFTVFRPENMEESGLCHPVITWGNGTGSTPNLYGGLLRHLASHGFVVVGSNSTNVSRGDPKPMNVGIDWVLEQNEDPTSVLYQRIDTAHIGATGHSQGAMATTQASSDERIVTSLPIEGASAQRDLHGPAMFFCGGLDDIVGCDGAVRALEAVTTLPAMYANYLSVDHGSWLSFGGNSRTDVEIAITAWMRVHLMADTALRPWFYGASCELCTNSAWEIDRKNMDE